MTIHNHERIVAAHYKETRPGGADGLLYKRDTERYTTLYEQVDGLSFADVAESIAELTVAAGAGWHSTDPYADAVTGATLSFSRAAALLNRTAAVRTAAALPRRLCD
jgi:hypothetical protein